MPPRQVELTIFLIDDKTEDVAQIHEYLSMMFFCAKRKIFSSPTLQKTPDLGAVVIYNAAKDHFGDYNHVDKVLKWNNYDLDNLKEFLNKTQAIDGSLVNALENALAYFVCASDCFEKKMTFIKRIVVFSDFKSPFEYTNGLKKRANLLKKQFKENEVWLYVVGPEINENKVFFDKDIHTNSFLKLCEKADLQTNNFEVISDVMYKGIIADYVNGYHLYNSYVKDDKKPFPWYIELDIGTDIQKKVCVYKCTRKPEVVKRRHTTGPVKKNWVEKTSRNQLNHEDVIQAYKVQNRVVQFTEEQEKEISKQDSKKCLRVLGFFDANKISKVYFTEGSMHRIVPDMRTGQDCTQFLGTLHKIMSSKNLAMLIARAYNNGFNVNHFMAFPCPDHESQTCILMTQIPSKHQYQPMYSEFTKIKKDVAHDEKLKTFISKLMNSLTLKEEDKGDIILPIDFTMQQDPCIEYLSHKTAAKILGSCELRYCRFDIPETMKERMQSPEKKLLNYLKSLKTVVNEEEYNFD